MTPGPNPPELRRLSIRLPRPRWIGAAMIAMIGVLLLAGAAWWIGGPVISSRTLSAIRGANKNEVRELLGNPSEVLPYGDWIYDRPLNPGWVAISFDDDDRASHINDEQALPEFFGSGSYEQIAAGPRASISDETGVEEDKAEMFANLIVDLEYVESRAKKDRVISAKVAYMKELLARFCPEMNDEFWEKVRKMKRSDK